MLSISVVLDSWVENSGLDSKEQCILCQLGSFIHGLDWIKPVQSKNVDFYTTDCLKKSFWSTVPVRGSESTVLVTTQLERSIQTTTHGVSSVGD